MDLDNGFSAGHGIVVHVGVEKREAPGDEHFHLVGIKLVAHANFERSGNDRDVFSVRVPVGRDAEPIRHLTYGPFLMSPKIFTQNFLEDLAGTAFR